MTTEQLARFWEAGQRRTRREERNRLAGMFAAFADALRQVVVPLWAGRRGVTERPWYLEPDAEERAAIGGRDLARLARDFGGVVVRGEFEFRN